MEIEVNIGKEYEQNKVVIYANSLSTEVEDIVEMIKKHNEKSILGIREEQIYLLDTEDIETFYSEFGKVFARTSEGTYLIKKRLYELEEILPQNFIRISNSEIVNFKKIEKLDMNIAGTICLIFKNSMQTYVSRRYIKLIKKYLKI